MSKSDLAQAAARHFLELIVISDQPSEELLSTMAEEYEIEPNVLRAWLLRDFESLDAVDSWAATRRDDIRHLPELERRRIAKLREDLDGEWRDIEAEYDELLSEMRKALRKKYAHD